MLETKVCRLCHQAKPTSCYGLQRPTGTLLRTECRECRKELSKKWRLSNPERYREICLASRERHRKEIQARDRLYAATHSEKVRTRQILWRKRLQSDANAYRELKKHTLVFGRLVVGVV
jgi:hypothetical protein